MKEGAFAVLDCLGFKGIWKRTSADKVVEKLEAVNAWATSDEWIESDPFLKTYSGNLSLKLTLLSDTIAISVQQPTTEELKLPPFILVSKLIDLILIVNSRFIGDEPCIPLRGTVTFGEHLITDRFIIGPAVDRAAELEKLANGAFIWMDDKAGKAYKEYMSFMKEVGFPSMSDGDLARFLSDESRTVSDRIAHAAVSEIGFLGKAISDYSVPLKGGERYKCCVVDPFFEQSSTDRIRIRDNYDRVMTNEDRLDVMIKRAHTMEFLDTSLATHAEYGRKYVRYVASKQLQDAEQCDSDGTRSLLSILNRQNTNDDQTSGS